MTASHNQDKSQLQASAAPASNRRRSFWIWLIACLIVVGIGAAFVPSWISGKMMGKAKVAGTEEVESAKTGQRLKVILEISDLDPTSGTFAGKQVVRDGRDHYLRTKQRIWGHWSESTHLEMGARSDVKVGAVVHVTGTLRDDSALEITQIVILTGYITVEDQALGGPR